MVIYKHMFEEFSEKEAASQYQFLNLSESPLTYSDNVNSEDYISQFLAVIAKDQPEDKLKLSAPSIDSIRSIPLDESELFDSPHSEKAASKRTKSIFHNFQKHLVITLRHSINMKGLSDCSNTGGLEKRLWQFFLDCPQMTRSLLYIVYGGMDMEAGQNKKILKQYGTINVLKNEATSTIRQAQRNLREETLKQAEQINLEWQLGNRRMKNKQDFKTYFEAFLEELKEGNFRKRIPKEKRQKSGRGAKQNRDFQGLSSNKA